MNSRSLFNRTALNAAANMGEQLILGVTMFVMYGYLARQCGLAQIGIMSLALVIGQAAQTANIGMASALNRFVPMAASRGDDEGLAKYIETALITTTLFFIIFCIISYWPLYFFVTSTASYDLQEIAGQMVLPATLYVLFLNLSLVPLTALAALQKATIRSIFSSVSAIIGLIAIFIFVPFYGIKAAIWVMALQSLFMFIASWIYLATQVEFLHKIPISLDVNKGKELFKLGISMQLISIFLLFLEPITRFYIGYFGTLEQLAVFTMAWRMVVQIRGLIYYAATAMLPVFALLNETDVTHRNETLRKFNSALSLIAIPIFFTIILISNNIGFLWLGNTNSDFTVYTILLSLFTIPNTICIGIYLMATGSGIIKGNIIAHATMAGANIILGAIFTYSYGGIGGVISISISLLIVSLLIIKLNQIIFNVHLYHIFDLHILYLFFASIIAVFIYYMTYEDISIYVTKTYNLYQQNYVQYISAIYAIILITIFIFPFIATHPITKNLLRYVTGDK